MPQRSLEAIVKKRLKQYKTERIVLLLLIAVGVILTLAGIGVYFYVGKLTLVQKTYATPPKNFMMFELRLLCDYARALGVIFSLIGVVSIILALDRLAFSKESYRVALYIDSQKEE
ncbi:hypothetical protein DRJ00_03910 [Candidatus Aerophobetes bacterium]|uniref:Uncharacterized protein n=1 Tax=Aerophobetes bacterium TaxID=2030807 RepID=A0A497E5Z5_UNCAE|nr:MAG: hypothetical protein DRJ00_03910 [Candidatus Aerophobetes bacterium]